MAPINGSNDADIFDGTSGDDEIKGLGGNDVINALMGNDTIDAIVDDVDIALERYRDGDNLIVPQEAHLFQAVNH